MTDQTNHNQPVKIPDYKFYWAAVKAVPAVLLVVFGLTFQPVIAQTTDLADILEQAAYEQQTANNPQRAIELYRQVIESENASRVMLAQALYNTGVCQQTLNQPEKAKQSFSAIVSQYKGIEPYFSLADQQINPGFTPIAATWPDGERLKFEVRANNLDEVRGYYWTSTTKLNWDGRPAIKLLNRSMGNNGMSSIVVDAETSRPLYSEAYNPNITKTTVKGTWSDNQLVVDSGNGELKNYKIDSEVYDAEQQYWLFRQIPFELGSKVRIKFQSIIISKAPEPIDFEVVSEESLEVTAGTFNAYKISAHGGLANMWVEAGPERRLLKIQSPTINFQLAGIEQVTPGTWQTLSSEVSDFNLSIPSEWYFVRKMGESKYEVSKTTEAGTNNSRLTLPREEFTIRDEIGKLNAQIYIIDTAPLAEYDDQDLSFAGRVAYSREIMEKNIDKFSVREGTSHDWSINGLSVHSNVGDYVNREEPWVYYSTYAMQDGKVMWFGAYTQKDNYEENKAQFDAIINTIKTY